MQANLKPYFAEFVGTFMLVLAGCGAIVSLGDAGWAGHIGIALTFGLVVMTGIYAVGETSGAHFNPAVTLAFWWAGRFPAIEVPKYISSQCLAAIAACGVLYAIQPDMPTATQSTLGATLPTAGWWQSWLLEFILTWWLVIVILSVATGAKEKGLFAGLAIGACVALEAMFAGPFTGASMNPARSLGPALFSGHWDVLWIYCTAPIAGALFGVFTCPHIHTEPCCTPSE